MWHCGAAAGTELIPLNPLVSVVVPAHNAERTITRALDSVLVQAFERLEVIVVDDRSSDGTARAVAEHPLAAMLVKSDRPGAARARNVGIGCSSGMYVAFLDADDYWLPGKLATQLRSMRAFPDCGLCYSTFLQQEAGGRFIPPSWWKSSEDVTVLTDLSEILRNPYLGTPGVLARRDLLVQLGGFREELKTAEDVDLWLRMGAAAPIISIGWPLFVVCRSSTSLSALAGDETYEANLGVLDDLAHKQGTKDGRIDLALRRSRARVYCAWGSAALCRNDFGLARSKLVASLRCAPTLRASYLALKSLIFGIRSG